jgi:hypothetical protein
MPLKALLSIYLIAGLVLATFLCSYGIFAAITGRNVSGSAEERIRVLGFFSLSSHGNPLGYVLGGIAVFALCLIVLTRYIPR